MHKPFSVLILGYGEMGHAMEVLLRDKHELLIWEKFPQPGFQSVDLVSAVPVADIIIFCLPVNPHREVLTTIKPYLSNHSLCISIAKGLDETGSTAAQIFQASLDPSRFALLYGPMISEEIRAGRPAFAQVGCADDGAYDAITKLFQGCPLYLEQTSDITGISWSVVLKNVYAMAFGIADELEMGDNVRGFLAVTALRELEQIVRGMGGKTGSPYHLAGLGDLITTATSDSSHHHELGRMLARGETENIRGEGVHSLQMVKRYRLLDISHYALFQQIDRAVENPAQTSELFKAYLSETFTRL